MTRQRISSNSPWEPIAGYSRAVRVGPFVHVAGTTAVDEHGEVVGRGNVRAQTVRAIENIERALMRLGASLQDVVRTRIYVTDIGSWEVVARVHGEYFGDVRPVSTLVAVSALVAPELLVEIEAEAILPERAEPASSRA